MNDTYIDVDPAPAETPLTIDELLAARASIDKEIAARRDETIEDIKRYIAEFNITQADIFGKTRKALPPKYRDPATGKTWSGKGKAPAWIKDLDETSRDLLKV